MGEFLLAILLIYLFYRLLKLLFPWLLAFYISKKSKDIFNQANMSGNTGRFKGGAYGRDNKREKEGNVTVQRGSAKEKKIIGKEVGEYVDFEEEK